MLKSDTFVKLESDLKIVDQDPNFTKIFIPSIIGIYEALLKGKLSDAVDCIDVVQSLLETKTYPKGITCGLPILNKLLKPPAPVKPTVTTKTSGTVSKQIMLI